MDNAPIFESYDLFEPGGFAWPISTAPATQTSSTSAMTASRSSLIRRETPGAPPIARALSADRRSHRNRGRRSFGQRHRMSGVVIRSGRQRHDAHALYRPDGRTEAVPHGLYDQQHGHRDRRAIRRIDAVLSARSSGGASLGDEAAVPCARRPSTPNQRPGLEHPACLHLPLPSRLLRRRRTRIPRLRLCRNGAMPNKSSAISRCRLLSPRPGSTTVLSSKEGTSKPTSKTRRMGNISSAIVRQHSCRTPISPDNLSVG